MTDDAPVHLLRPLYVDRSWPSHGPFFRPNRWPSPLKAMAGLMIYGFRGAETHVS